MNACLARLSRLAVDLCHEADASLLDGFLAGNEPAFRELVFRHGPLVFGVCNRILRHRQDAEDAFQAVFVVLARRAADVWPRDAVGSWLYGVAYRVAQKARVLRARRLERELPLEDVARVESPHQEPDTAEVIDRVVRKLPEVYRAAVVACDLEGLSRRDAAGQLGWTEGTLSGRLARARKLLADRLRKAGVSLPAAGLATALGTGAPVRAELEDTVVGIVSIDVATAVSAPVAALTIGVVPSMYAMKLKSLAAVVVVAFTVGYGAWTASGAGNGRDGEKQPGLALASAPVRPKKAEAAEPSKILAALEPLQGKWRIVTIAEGKTTTVLWTDEPGEVEITGAALSMPYRESGGNRKRQEFKIRVDDTKPMRTIDLIAPSKPVGLGIYELTSTAMTCASCHKTEGLGFDSHKTINLGLCEPAYKHTGAKTAQGMRLAIGTAGQRPERFGSGAEGVIEFTLERVAVKPDVERERMKRETERLMAMLEFTTSAEQRKELLSRLAGFRVSVAESEVEAARAELRAAAAIADEAQAQVERAAAQYTLASRKFQAAQAKLEAAQKEAESAGKPPRPAPNEKSGEHFTIHVRPLASSEKIIRVKATGKDTVLEGLAYAAEDMAIKAETISVWVVRGKEVLPVDLAAITLKGETKTNYVLKAGDQLFVQVKVAK